MPARGGRPAQVHPAEVLTDLQRRIRTAPMERAAASSGLVHEVPRDELERAWRGRILELDHAATLELNGGPARGAVWQD